MTETFDNRQSIVEPTGAPAYRPASRTAETMAGANRWLLVFYVGVATAALVGQTLAATGWLRWPWFIAALAVGLVELGGIALATYADARRRLKERALAARLLSAAVAAGATALNWFGHTDHLAGGFFAGLSALGYGVWLLDSAARRRDRLRAEGDMAAAPPVFDAAHWLRHPWITRRARALAKANPALNVHAALAAAVAAIQRERRNAALADALRRRITDAVDPVMAQIAILTYDLDQIADRLRANADYDGLTALIAGDLDPTRLAGHPARPGQPGRRNGQRTGTAGGTGPGDRDTTSRTTHRDEATPAVGTERDASRGGTQSRRRDSSPSRDNGSRTGSGDVKSRMRVYAETRLTAGTPVTGAELDREFGTSDYGRRIIRELTTAPAEPAAIG